MGEIDTKPIESVQVALSLFGEKSDQKKHRPSSSDLDSERETDVEWLQKDLANYKLELEAKDSAHKQALLELEHYQKTAEGLADLLKNSEVEREKQVEEYKNVKNQVEELELKIKQMADQLFGTTNIHKQLSNVLDELEFTQTELAAARDAELKATTRAELMEMATAMEKEKSEELLRQISGLHDSVLMAKMEISELERQKQEILGKKEAELEIVMATAVQAQEQLEDQRTQLEVVIELKSQLLDKSVHIETLKTELKQANDAVSLMEDSASDARDELNCLKEVLESQMKMNSEQAIYIETLETELHQVKLELENANDTEVHLSKVIEMLSVDLVKAQRGVEEMKGRENDAEVEISLLKAELLKVRPKIAAAEEPEARTKNVQSGLYLAAQQLAVDAEVKEEKQKLKHEAERSTIPDHVNETKAGAEDKNVAYVTTSNGSEIEALKKELEAAAIKIREFRTRAEQAITRAEVAEKAKAALEEQIKRWQEQKQRRKAALAALRQESEPKRFNPPAYEQVQASHQPLGKVLNLKF